MSSLCFHPELKKIFGLYTHVHPMLNASSERSVRFSSLLIFFNELLLYKELCVYFFHRSKTGLTQRKVNELVTVSCSDLCHWYLERKTVNVFHFLFFKHSFSEYIGQKVACTNEVEFHNKKPYHVRGEILLLKHF